MILGTVDNAIAAIRNHQPFHEICWRLGLVAHYLADANNPLNSDEQDQEKGRYFADFLYYLEHVEPRIEMVFYGFRPEFDGRRDLPSLLEETLARSRGFYPLVGREYRQIHFGSGTEAFDDRSTAYGIASLAYSHSDSAITEAESSQDLI